MKKCLKCGCINADANVFCNNCNERFNSFTITNNKKSDSKSWLSIDNKQNKDLLNNKKITTIAVASVLIIAISVLILVFLINKKTDLKVDNNYLTQANMTSWGYAVFNNDYFYYSDRENGIYRVNENDEKELIIRGQYSDLGLLEDMIYCVEYLNTNEDKSKPCIVGINITDYNKKIIYDSTTEDTQLIGVNVINNQYFFTVDNDSLFTINNKGEFENTGIRSVKSVNESGIYTTEVSKFGLKFQSFDNKIIKTYDKLKNYEVYVFFELNNYVYLHFKNGNNAEVYYMDKNSGELFLFNNDKSFYEDNISSYLNYYNDIFYLSISKNLDNGIVEHKVYSIDSKGNIKNVYCQNSENGLPFCTLNIAKNNLIISFPITSISTVFIKLE